METPIDLTGPEYALPDEPPEPFRCGHGGHLWLEGREFRRDTRVRISPNTTHALLGHGIVDALNAVPLDGTLGQGLDVVVPQDRLQEARRVLYAADAKTYGAANRNTVFEVGKDAQGALCRVRIDNREFQQGLARLTDLLRSAAQVGHAAWLRL